MIPVVDLPSRMPRPPPRPATGQRHREGARHAGGAGRELLVRRPPGPRPGLADDARRRHHRADRPVRLRQVDVPAHPQPDARAGAERPAGRRGAARREGRLRARPEADRRPPRDRHGVPEAQPVPGDVDPRQRARRAQAHRHQGVALARRTSSSSTACGSAACGTRSRTASTLPAAGLSGGQQQRLCIARSMAIKPRVLLMDEPCSALDPTSTRVIEETMKYLAQEVTIVIVTHNMQQAARVSDQTAFFLASHNTPGVIVEHGDTSAMFEQPPGPAHPRLRPRTVRLSGSRRVVGLATTGGVLAGLARLVAAVGGTGRRTRPVLAGRRTGRARRASRPGRVRVPVSAADADRQRGVGLPDRDARPGSRSRPSGRTPPRPCARAGTSPAATWAGRRWPGSAGWSRSTARSAAAMLETDGRSDRPVLGPALDGRGDVAAIRRPPAGGSEPTGPLQFLPSTWDALGRGRRRRRGRRPAGSRRRGAGRGPLPLRGRRRPRGPGPAG